MACIASPTPYLALSGGTLAGDLTTSAHIQANGTAPSAAAGSSAGGSPPAPVLQAGANDMAGRITFGTGTAPGAGPQVTVTYATPWNIPGGGNVHVVVTASNNATAALNLYVSGISTTAFTLAAANAPAAGQANTVYSFNYIAIG